jgi:hypothetical protein
MSGDPSIARAKNGSGVINALFDQIGVTDGVLTDRPIYDLSLGGVDERGEVADSFLRALVDFDGCLAHGTSLAPSIEVPKYLVNAP